MSNTVVSVEAVKGCQNMSTYFFVLIFIGGQTIRNIIKASGAHVELNRNIPESSPTKCFIIRGKPNLKMIPARVEREERK